MGSLHEVGASPATVRVLGESQAPAALLLTGDLGLGHHMVTEVVADSFARMGWRTEVVDCMSLLGSWSSRLGDGVFRGLIRLPTLYDGIHFSHFRTGSWLARLLDRMAVKRLVPALSPQLADREFDVVVATFATGASAIGRLFEKGRPGPRPATVVLCTDATPHSLWVTSGVDLFLVTSESAAAAIRRYSPRARVTVVAPPVRTGFYEAPTQAEARAELGIDGTDRCVLLMGGGWGLGPLAGTARLLAEHDVTVLAVAGRNARLAKALRDEARSRPRIRSFGYTPDIPRLMAAADLVLTTPGATTCSEARVIGRPLLLLDVIPGHGRDNIQRELETGSADVCDPDPYRLTANVLAALDRTIGTHALRASRDRFGEEFAASLMSIGIEKIGTRHRARGHGRGVRQGTTLEEIDFQ